MQQHIIYNFESFLCLFWCRIDPNRQARCTAIKSPVDIEEIRSLLVLVEKSRIEINSACQGVIDSTLDRCFSVLMCCAACCLCLRFKQFALIMSIPS